MLRFPTFTTAIYDQFQSTFNGPAATMLAGVARAVCCLLLLLAELRLRGRARYARVGGGAARPVAACAARCGRPCRSLAALATLVVLALGVPIGSRRALADRRRLDGVSRAPLLSRPATSLGLGAVGGRGDRAARAPGRLAVRAAPRPADDRCSSAARTSAARCPGIVVALALVTVSIRPRRPLYQTTPMLLAAYAILFIPRAW